MARRVLFLCAWLAIASTMASASADRNAAGRGRHAPTDPTPPRVENEWIARTIPARWGHQLLFDASRNRVIVVGGSQGGAIWGDAWAIDLDAPVHAERVTKSSSDRFGPGIAAAIDPRTDRVVVHGGERYGVVDGPPGSYVGDQGGPLAASMSGNGEWTWLDDPYRLGPGRPARRHGHVAVVDESGRRVVMFGGSSYHDIYGYLGLAEQKHDVWTWALDEPQHWDSLAVDGAVPTETIGDGAAWDPALDVVWYVARGGLWRLNLASARWDSIPVTGAFSSVRDPVPASQAYFPIPPGPEAFVALDPAGRRLYRYVPSVGVQSLNVDAPNSWAALAVGGEPGATFGPIAWDSRARRLLRFAGADTLPDLWHDNRVEGPVLWGLSVDHPERGWETLYDARVPKVETVTGVYDARRDRVLAIDRNHPFDGLYELRGGQTQWNYLPSGIAPPLYPVEGLSNLVLDETRDRLVMDMMVYQYTMEYASTTFSYDLRAQDGWQRIGGSGWPYGTNLAWDAGRQRVIRFAWSGLGSIGVEALEGDPGSEQWKPIPVAGESPEFRYVPIVGSDPERGRVFMTGGYVAEPEDAQSLWILDVADSARWTKQRHSAEFSDHDWPAGVWDPTRKRLMIQGAYGGCCGWRMDGVGITAAGATDPFAFPGTNWEWWTPHRYGGGLVYDGMHDSFVIFGGVKGALDAYEIAFAKAIRTIRVDARPGAGNDRVRPGTHQSLQIAALSDPGFDARTLDLTTVRVAGVPIRRDGGGRPKFNVRDVDGDGRDDIVLAFDAHDLPITESNSLVKLWGRTFDDARVEGLATVELKTRVAGKNAGLSPTTKVDGPVFAVRTTGAAGSIRFACTVAGYPGASLEAFDIAGRRVASGLAPSQTGASVVDLTPEAPLTRGIYLVRLTGPVTLSRKVVALP